VQIDFENNKELMVKIEMEIKGEKKIEVQKREKLYLIGTILVWNQTISRTLC